MKIVMTGKGTSGSWSIRGVQLGKAMGASVEPMALSSRADIAVAVKRIPDQLAKALAGRLVWDILDAYPQPHGNRWSEAECKQWLAKELRRIQPIGIIAATQQMAEDCEFSGIPTLWLPHHYRPGIERNQIRPEIGVIGYEGSVRYLDGWRAAIDAECRRIGARFVVNPPSLADVDVVLALRSDTGYAPRNWKSNVKLSNAHGSGTPFIGCRERGYLETAVGGEQWADDAKQLAAAMDALAPQSVRQDVSSSFILGALSIDTEAGRLKKWLRAL